MNLFKELNNDQLDGLAKLSFDLARGSLLLALFPAVELISNPLLTFLRILMSLSLGLVFTYIALILLKAKEYAR